MVVVLFLFWEISIPFAALAYEVFPYALSIAENSYLSGIYVLQDKSWKMENMVALPCTKPAFSMQSLHWIIVEYYVFLSTLKN